MDMPPGPLFAFGYGLSYTTFAYSKLNLHTKELATGETLHVEIDVENTGQRAGTEIVQLYVRDLVGNVTRPVRELKASQQVSA